MRGVVLGMDYSNIKGEYLNGVYSELANLLGIEVVLKIHNTYRGQQVTFPVQLFSRDFIMQEIFMTKDMLFLSLMAIHFHLRGYQTIMHDL